MLNASRRGDRPPIDMEVYGAGSSRISFAVAAQLLLVTLTAVLLFAGTAAARGPTLNSAQYESGTLTATWSLPPGAVADSFLGSRSPRLEPNGRLHTLEIYRNLKGNATSITVRQGYERQSELYTFEPDTYYVQVESRECESCPTYEYSEARAIVVSDGFRKDADFTCKTFVPDARSDAQHIRQAHTIRQLVAALDRAATTVREVVADLRDNPTPPRGAKRQARYRAMLGANRQTSRYYQAFASAVRAGNLNRVKAIARKFAKSAKIAEGEARRLGLPTCKLLMGENQ